MPRPVADPVGQCRLDQGRVMLFLPPEGRNLTVQDLDRPPLGHNRDRTSAPANTTPAGAQPKPPPAAIPADHRAQTGNVSPKATRKLSTQTHARSLNTRVMAAMLGDRPLAAGGKFCGMDALDHGPYWLHAGCRPCGDGSRLVPPPAGQPLALRSGPASTRRERGAGRVAGHPARTARDGRRRAAGGHAWTSAGLTSGCAGTRRSAAGTKQSWGCGSRRRGSGSPG